MENTINTLFGNGQFINIYLTSDNPAKIETIDISKIDNEIKEVKNTQTFNLVRHDIPKSGIISLNIREKIKNDLISKLNLFSENHRLKYFNLGLIKNLFVKRNIDTLLNSFKGNDWVITSDKIILELSKSNSYEPLQDYGDIRLSGRINNTLIYKIKDVDNIIYTGKNGSITGIFNNKIFNKNGVSIEYLLEINDIKKITVS